MKNQEILNLHQGLVNCGKLKGIKFAFAVAKNRKALAGVIEPFMETRKKLQEEHSVKDKDGKQIIEKGQIKMKSLEKFNEEYEKLINIEVEIKLHKVDQKDIPEDITAGQLSGIMEIIKE